MSAQLLLGLQFTFSLIIFSMIAKWYIMPALNKLPIHEALMPLFLTHALLYLPSTAFAPRQVDATMPMDATVGLGHREPTVVFATAPTNFRNCRSGPRAGIPEAPLCPKPSWSTTEPSSPPRHPAS